MWGRIMKPIFRVPKESSERDWNEEEMDWLEDDWGEFSIDWFKYNRTSTTDKQKHAFSYGWALAMKKREDRGL